MNEDSREGEDQAGSSTEEDDQSPSLQLLRERRPLPMSKSGEGMYLTMYADKLFGNKYCCGC